MSYTHRVTALNGLFLRTGPSVNFPRLGLMPYGTPLRVTLTDAGGWHKLDLATNLVPSAKVNGIELLQYNPQSPVAYGYCSAAYTEKWVEAPPPPAPTSKTRLGVNVITGDVGAAQRAIAAGCNAISLINNFLGASQLAMNPAITVMARRYVSSMPPADPDLLFEGAESPNVVYLTPLNEQDVSAYGTVQQIKDRAGFDGEMWRKMKAKGRKYAGGGFSVGTPEFNDPAICQALKDYYAPLYADGMAMNHHLYSPWPNHPMDHWYELRWRFFFERCGFDTNPNLAGIYSDETGMDQGSVGGFPQVGYSPEQVGAWSRAFLDASQANGYGNRLRAAAVFQSGNTTDWKGYNVDRPDYLAAIGAAAQAPVGTFTTRGLAIPEVQPVIHPTPRKIIAQYE